MKIMLIFRLSTSSVHLAQSSSNRLESSGSESCSTRVASRTRRKRPSSFVTRVAAEDLWPVDDDDATSLYSLDQDGFYTSMHADSGLSRSNRTLTPGDGADDLSECTESVSSSWDANTVNCEEEEDEDSKTVIFDDWIPAMSAAKPDGKPKPVSVSGDEVASLLEEKGFLSDKDRFQNSQDADRYSEKVFKALESICSAVGFPSFCAVTRDSSDADDRSLRGSLGNDALADCSLATRLSFGSSQDTSEAADVSLTVGVETPEQSDDRVDFCRPSCDGKLEDSSAEPNQKHEDLGIKPTKQRLTSESALLSSQHPDGSTVWMMSKASNTLNCVKGILKSKKKKPFLHSKSINFGPITSLDEILKSKLTPLTIGSSEDVKSVTSYGIPVFSGSSFLGKDDDGTKGPKKKEHAQKESEALTRSSNTAEAVGVLPLKYKPVIVAKPKQRVKDNDVTVSDGHASNESMTGYGYLGKEAISSCAGTATVDGRLASQDLTPQKTNLAPVSAKLVITSPVVERTAYVENPHKRSLCTPLTPQDLPQYSSYNDPESWYNTLPRKSSVRKKIALSGGDHLTTPVARFPYSGSLRSGRNVARVGKTLLPEQENNSEIRASDEVGNTDCFAMNFANCGTVKRAKTLTRSVAAVPALPAAQTVMRQNSLCDQRVTNHQISTLPRSSQNADACSTSTKVNRASLDHDSLSSIPVEESFHSRETESNGVSWTSTSPIVKSNNTNNALETCLLKNAVHSRAKSISSQIVDQPEAFDTVDLKSKHVAHNSENQIVDQPDAFHCISASHNCLSGEECKVLEGEVQNKKDNALVRTFSSSSSDSSPDVVSSCESGLTISSTSFAKSQESISSILSASERNHNARITFLSSESCDVRNANAALETHDPFLRYAVGKSNPRSTSLASANTKIPSVESPTNSFDSDKTPESSSRLMQLPSNSVKTCLAQSSTTQKQSFESDSSGF